MQLPLPGNLVGLVATDGADFFHERPAGESSGVHHSQPDSGDGHAGRRLRYHGEHIWPAGAGSSLLLRALTDRDYPVVSGVNLVFATAVLGINLIIDLMYPILDPRVRYK